MAPPPHEGDVRRHVRSAMRQSISAYVEQNVDRWSLDVNAILKNFGVSRASLYRIFEDRGGVRQYISNRRLLRAALDISKGPLLRGEISAVAERWGFSSAANFNRAIRREFGVTPGSLINLPDDEETKLTGWMNSKDFRVVADESVERIARSDLLVSS